MSSLKVSQIKKKLLSMFEQHLDLTDINPADPEREPKVLSRCLAAFCIYAKARCTEQEAAEAVWDGPDDDGIDAAYFDASEMRVLFVQSKWINKGSGEPEAKDIGAFTKGVRDVIEQNQDHFHSRLHARLSDLALRLSNPGTSVHILVISTGSTLLAKHGMAYLDGLLSELNGEDPDAIASAEVLGLAEVYSGLARDPLEGNVDLDATVLEWSYVATPYPAYFGIIDGSQLKSWWVKHGKAVLSSNIRHSLGSTEVNNEIRQTASTSPDKFWYFNNGITLVAEEAQKAPAKSASKAGGFFLFKGASIVNGAQTVSSLAKVEDDEKLGLVRVLIRVILLKHTPDGFGSEVTRTNNLQNRVEPRDFVAQDGQQKRLRQEMAIEGIDYQFVRSEDVAPTPTTCELVEVTTALACAAGDPNLAVQVKTGIGRFFADLSKAPYKTLFNPSMSGAKAFNSVVTIRAIESWIDKKKKLATKKSGPSWGVLVHGNRVLEAAVFVKLGSDKLTRPIADFATFMASANLEGICEDAYQKITTAIEMHYSGKFLATLFKNPTMSKHVFDIATQSTS